MDKKKDEVKHFVKERYGQVAENKKACCGGVSSCCSAPSAIEIKVGYSSRELEQIPKDAALGLGCGNPTALAEIKTGEVVLDLGSGGGIDCFLAAQRVGPAGKVIGVDMTEKMINLARRNAADGGYKNVEFRLGEIENLPVDDDTVDLVISNCVINLAPDKGQVFAEIQRVLKPGGRLIVSDLVTTERLPEEICRSLEAWAACIGGAMIKESYLDTIRAAGLSAIDILREQNYADELLPDSLRGKVLSLTVRATKPIICG